MHMWREGNFEVDYIVSLENKLFAIEVKSGRNRSRKGLEAFVSRYPKALPIFLTLENVERFLDNPVTFLETLA